MKYNTRIKKIIGQLEALARMPDDNGPECGHMLQQVSAVQGAVLSLKKQIIDDSLENCLESRHAEKDTKKLVTTIRRYI